MKKSTIRAMLLSVLLVALLVYPLGVRSVKAETPLPKTVSLNDSETIKATLSEIDMEGNQTISIVGFGKINKTLWYDMIATFELGSYGTWGGDITNKVTLSITPDAEQLIQLPDDSSGLFSNFYGPVELSTTVDVSNVTNMCYMFSQAKTANPDISHWDVSNVTKMESMFQNAKVANPDVSQWDVSNVTTMKSMFYYAKAANPDVSNWDVSKVTNMFYIFMGSGLKNLDMTNWNTSSFNVIASFSDVYLCHGLVLDSFAMKQYPGSDSQYTYDDNGQAKSIGDNYIKNFQSPSFSGDYIVETYDVAGDLVKTERIEQTETYAFKNNTHYKAYVIKDEPIPEPDPEPQPDPEPVPVPLQGWHVVDHKERYYVNGEYLTGLHKIGNTVYLFASDGDKQRGWHVIEGKEMYFDLSNGGRLTGLKKIGQTVYLLTADGKQKGWHVINGQELYFDQITGGMLTGKRTIGKTTYLLTASGKKTGWHVLSGKKYYFTPEYGGGMVTGLRTAGGKAQYFFRTQDSEAGADDRGSAMVSTQVVLNGKVYTLNEHGIVVNIR